jgi:deoxyribonuclease V
VQVEPAFADVDALVAAQDVIGRLEPPAWRPSREPLRAAGAFVAFARGEQGPGRAGDRAWVGAALVEDGEPRTSVVVAGTAGAPYRPGLLALREGTLLLTGLRALLDALDDPPDVVMVDATGRDHPRRCGLAVHLGALLDLPTVGVTDRLLGDRRQAPPALVGRGATSRVILDGLPVAAWVRTAPGARPVIAHAAWRTDVETAVAVVVRTSGGVRRPEPLRAAPRAAREARSVGGAPAPARLSDGRPPSWRSRPSSPTS